MKNNLTKQSVFTMQNLINCFIIMYMIAPVISRIVSTYLSTYLYMLLIVCVVFFVFLKLEQEPRSALWSLLIPFFMYQFLTFFTNRNDIFLWGYRVLLFLLPLILGFFILQKTPIEIMGTTKLMFTTFLITAITTIIGLIQYPGASRLSATFAESQDTEAILYSWHNIGGYEFVYMVLLMYPLVILAYKQRKINLFVTVLLSVSILMLILYSEYTTALLFFIITSLLFFFKRDLKPSNIIVLSIFSLVIILFFSDYLTEYIGKLADVVDSETMSYRLETLAGGKKGLEESEDNRLELYMISINTFFKHFLFGSFITGRTDTGGHSFILDSLANYGMLGGILLISMYRKVYFTFYLKYKDKKGYGYVLWIFIQAIVLSVINTGMWLEVLALFSPMFLYCIYKEEENTNEDSMDSKHSVGTIK